MKRCNLPNCDKPAYKNTCKCEDCFREYNRARDRDKVDRMRVRRKELRQKNLELKLEGRGKEVTKFIVSKRDRGVMRYPSLSRRKDQ